MKMAGTLKQLMVFKFYSGLSSLLHATGGGGGDPPRQVARSAKPGNQLTRVKFCHAKVSTWGNPASRDQIYFNSQ